MPELELLEPPDIPLAVEYLWDLFWQLDGGRSLGFGLSPLSYSDIGWYGLLMEVEFEPWEVKTIKRMDAARLKATESKTDGGF